MSISGARAAGVKQDERGEGDSKEHERGVVGLGVGEILHLVVDGDGESARGAGNVAADHEDDAEFSDGVGEAEGGGCEDGAGGEREENLAKDAEASCAEKASLFYQRGVNGVEAGGERLHGEGQAVDDGANDESGEREGEGMAEEMRDAAAEGGALAEKDEQIEAEDRGRQQDGEGREGFHERAQRRAGADDPEGERNGDHEQNRRGDGSETRGEPKSLEIHLMNWLEPAGCQLTRDRWRAEEVEEALRRGGVGAVADDDGSLHDGRVGGLWNDDVVSVGAEARGERGGE